MKIIFMGTPDYAVGALEALIEAGHEIVAVVTQPDKARGRSKEFVYPPVKECALRHNIPVMQPKRIKTPEAMAQLKAYGAELFVVAAFGQILSRDILEMPRYGSINIHASLLPGYRGASPIQHVILNGEEKTGITVMQMDEGIDTGDMLYKVEVPITPEETYETLHDKLKEAGGRAIVEALALLAEGRLIPEKQDDEKSCYASLIDKKMGEIDFTQDASSIERKVRAMNPWPSAYTFLNGKQLKVWEAKEADTISGLQPGQIAEVTRDYVSIATGRGTLRVYSLQLEGKKRMSTHDFLLGVKLKPGELLGGE